MESTKSGPSPAGLVSGKRGVVFGVANRRSIAWGIAQALSRGGARLAFAYQGERLRDKVEELTRELPGPPPLYSCDVTRDEDIRSTFEGVQRDLGGLDILVHSIAFAQKEDLERDFVETSRPGFLLALEISAFSLGALA